jgi:prepilin-type N-terminal cleavage/methylation domain-containing protein
MRTHSNRSKTRKRAQAHSERGFTLIEASMATIIIGIGVLAMVDAQSSFITSNLWSNHAASATFLANEVRELTRTLPKHDPVHGLYIDEDSGALIGWGPNAGETTLDDFDDIDDFDGISFSDTGTPGLNDGDLPGPINAFGEIIPEIAVDGTELGGIVDDAFTGQAMTGWTQRVIVEKIAPFDTSVVRADAFFEEPNGSFPGRAVDEYPLRVTVQVLYQGTNDITASIVTEVVWVVP